MASPHLDRHCELSEATGDRNPFGEWEVTNRTISTVYGRLERAGVKLSIATHYGDSRFESELTLLTRYDKRVLDNYNTDWKVRVDGSEYAIVNAYEATEYDRRRYMRLTLENERGRE